MLSFSPSLLVRLIVLVSLLVCLIFLPLTLLRCLSALSLSDATGRHFSYPVFLGVPLVGSNVAHANALGDHGGGKHDRL